MIHFATVSETFTGARSPNSPRQHASHFNFGQPIDTPAEQFASWLPYSAYLAEEKIFVNRDGMGFMLEVMMNVDFGTEVRDRPPGSKPDH